MNPLKDRGLIMEGTRMIASIPRAVAAGAAFLVVAGCAHSREETPIAPDTPPCLSGSNKDAEFTIRFYPDGRVKYEPKLDNTTYGNACRVKARKRIVFTSVAEPGATAKPFEIWFTGNVTPESGGAFAYRGEQLTPDGPYVATIEKLKPRKGNAGQGDDPLNRYEFEIRVDGQEIDPVIIIEPN